MHCKYNPFRYTTVFSNVIGCVVVCMSFFRMFKRDRNNLDHWGDDPEQHEAVERYLATPIWLMIHFLAFIFLFGFCVAVIVIIGTGLYELFIEACKYIGLI